MPREKVQLKERETDIVRTILDFLAFNDIFAWRNNTGAHPMSYINKQGKINRRFIRFGHKGSADIIGCLPDGKILAIECKTLTGKISSDQAVFIESITQNKGIAFIARNIEDVVDWIGDYLKTKQY